MKVSWKVCRRNLVLKWAYKNTRFNDLRKLLDFKKIPAFILSVVKREWFFLPFLPACRQAGLIPACIPRFLPFLRTGKVCLSPDNSSFIVHFRAFPFAFFPDFQVMSVVPDVPAGFLPLNRATMVAPTFKERVLKSP